VEPAVAWPRRPFRQSRAIPSGSSRFSCIWLLPRLAATARLSAAA